MTPDLLEALNHAWSSLAGATDEQERTAILRWIDRLFDLGKP